MSAENYKELEELLGKNNIHLSINFDTNDKETIWQKSKQLSFTEKTQLLKNYWIYPGTVLFDAGEALKATVQIDDRHSKASETRPLAYIKIQKGNRTLVEVIDILESVRSDATLIGHPVIVYAIHHWQQLIKWKKINEDKSIRGDDRIGWEISIKFIRSAEANLKAIGKALYKGATNQEVPVEFALAYQIKSLKIKAENAYLYVAWDRLHSKYINQSHDLEERVAVIENFLTQLPSSYNSKYLEDCPVELQKYGYIDSPLNISTVVDFLKSTKGRVFVYDEIECASLHPQWRVFVNAFLEWYFKMEYATINKYLKVARDQEIKGERYTAGFF